MNRLSLFCFPLGLLANVYIEMRRTARNSTCNDNVLYIEAVCAQIAAAGKGVLAGMPLAMGHTRPLLGRLKGPQDLWYAARALAKHRAELRSGASFRFLHNLPDMTGSQAALAYVLANPGVSAAVFGATRPAHLRENLAASALTLSADLMRRIRDAHHVTP